MTESMLSTAERSSTEFLLRVEGTASDFWGNAEIHGASVASVICGAFASFAHPQVFAVIGPSKITQLEDSMRGSDIQLTQAELAEIFKLDI